MNMKYVPTSFFRTLGNSYLKNIFDDNGIVLEGIDWETRDAARDRTVADAWSNLRQTRSADDAVINTHEIFQCISALAKASCESPEIIRLFESQGRFAHKLPDGSYDNLTRQEQAAYICHVEGKKMLMSLLDVAIARDMSYAPAWTEFGNAPKADIAPTKEMKDAIAKAVDEVFAEESKGGHCNVETYPFDDGVVYFLCKTDDKAEFIEMKRPGDEDYGFVPVIRPLMATIAYDPVRGKLSMLAKLTKKRMASLAGKAAAIITGQETQLERLSRPTYDLSALEDIGYKFPALPGTGVARVYAKALTILPDAAPGGDVTFRNKEGGSAYDTMADYHAGFPMETFKMVKASIAIEFTDAAIKGINFTLTPKSCSMTGLMDSQRKIVEQLIDRMQIAQ